VIIINPKNSTDAMNRLSAAGTLSAIITNSRNTHKGFCRSKLQDESRLIQICFDDNKGDDKKLKGQFMIIKE